MKKLLFLTSILPAMMLAGCSEGENTLNGNGELPTTDEPKEYIVSLGFSGEITDITESPLSKAATNDLYGIQVYSSPSTADDYKPYAYGLFDNIDNIVIKLLEGYKYKFVSTMIVNGKNRIQIHSGKYDLPFSDGDGYMPLNNNFVFSIINECSLFDAGVSVASEGAFHRPAIERFYGEVSGYSPLGEDGMVTINMKKVVFGVKFIAEGLTEGILRIQLEESPDLEIIYPNTEIEEIFTFQNQYPYGLTWTADDYSETIPVNITWQKNDGASIPLISRDITFKRNKLTTITIKVKDNSVNNGVDITTENESIQPGDNIVIDTSGPSEPGVEINTKTIV